MQTAFYLMKNYAKLVTEEGNNSNFLYAFIRVCKENLSLDNGKSATVTFHPIVYSPRALTYYSLYHNGRNLWIYCIIYNKALWYAVLHSWASLASRISGSVIRWSQNIISSVTWRFYTMGYPCVIKKCQDKKKCG